MTTEAHFNYEPTIEEIIKVVADADEKDPRKYPKNFDEQLKLKFETIYEQYETTQAKLIEDQ